MRKFRFLLIAITSVFFQWSVYADDLPGVSGAHDSTSHSDQEKLVLLAQHFDPKSYSPDFRFQRDAAVVAVGCGIIPDVFYSHKVSCYKTGLQLIRSGEETFGNVIDKVCRKVHSTLSSTDDSDSIFSDLFGILSYDECMLRLSRALPSTSIKSYYEECHSTEWVKAYTSLDECYSANIPHIETSLETLSTDRTIVVTDPRGSDQSGVIKRVREDFPARSTRDHIKLDALHGACTALKTSRLTEEEKDIERNRVLERMRTLLKSQVEQDQVVKENLILKLAGKSPEQFVNENPEVVGMPMSAYEFPLNSLFGDVHCFSDGFYELALGATVPGTILAACRNRIPLIDVHWNKKLKKIGLSDYKTACLRGGVRSVVYPQYQNLIIQSSHFGSFESPVNLIKGFWNNSIFEENLIIKNKDAIKQRETEEITKSKMNSSRYTREQVIDAILADPELLKAVNDAQKKKQESNQAEQQNLN